MPKKSSVKQPTDNARQLAKMVKEPAKIKKGKKNKKKAIKFIDLKVSEKPIDGMYKFLSVSSIKKETLKNYHIDPEFLIKKWQGDNLVGISVSEKNYKIIQENIKEATFFMSTSGKVDGVHRHFVRIEHNNQIYYVHFIIDNINGTSLAAKYNQKAKELKTNEIIQFRFNPSLNCIFIDEKGYLIWRAAASIKQNVPPPMTPQEYTKYFDSEANKYSYKVPEEVQLLVDNKVDIIPAIKERTSRFSWESPSFTPYKNDPGKFLVNENYNASVIKHCNNLNKSLELTWGFSNFCSIEYNEVNKPVIVILKENKNKVVNKMNEIAILGYEVVPWVTRSFLPIYSDKNTITSYRHYSFNYSIKQKGFQGFLNDNQVEKTAVNINYFPTQHYCEMDPASYEVLKGIYQKRFYNSNPFTLQDLVDCIKEHGKKYNISMPPDLEELYDSQQKILNPVSSDQNRREMDETTPLKQVQTVNKNRKRIIMDPEDFVEAKPISSSTSSFFSGSKISKEKVKESIEKSRINKTTKPQIKRVNRDSTATLQQTGSSVTHFSPVKIKKEPGMDQPKVNINAILEQMRNFLAPYKTGKQPNCSLVTKECMETLNKLVSGEKVDKFSISRVRKKPSNCNRFERTEYDIEIKNEDKECIGTEIIAHERLLRFGYFNNLPPQYPGIVDLEHPMQPVIVDTDFEPDGVSLRTCHYTKLRTEIIEQAQSKNAILIGLCNFDDVVDKTGHIISFLATKNEVYFLEIDQPHPNADFDVIFNELTDVYTFKNHPNQSSETSDANGYAKFLPYCRFMTQYTIHAEIEESYENHLKRDF